MKKLYLSLALFAAMASGANAQGDTGVLSFYGLQDYQVLHISPNGKWAVGIFTNGYSDGYGFRWNLETNECKLLSSNTSVSTAYCVADDGTVAGEFSDFTLSPNGAPVTNVGYYKDDKWHALEPMPNGTAAGGYSMAISPDGQWIGGASYDPDGLWVPTVWHNGKFYRQLGTTSGTVYAISPDGKKAAGWAYHPDGGDVRWSVIWDVETGEPTWLSTRGNFANQGVRFTSDGTKLLHMSSIDGRYCAGLYDVATGSNFALDNYFSSTPWALDYRCVDDSLNVFGYETSFDQTQNVGVVNRNNDITTISDYLAAKGFNIYNSGYPILMAVTASAVSADGNVIAVTAIDTGSYQRPIIIRFNENVTTRQPAGVEAVQAAGIMAAKLSWKAPLNNPTNLTGYNIYRDGVKLNDQPITSTIYVDPNLEAGTYTYAVTAVYGSAESVKSETADVTVDDIRPSAPRALYARQKGFNSASLTWNTPATNLVSLFYNDPNSDIIGFGGGSGQSFEVAIRYSHDEMAAYAGSNITKVTFIPRSEQLSWTVKIYDGDKLIRTQEVTQQLNYGAENVVVLNEPVDVSSLNGDITCAIAVGVDPLSEGNNVIGMVEGSCVQGYSDLAHLSTENSFYSLSKESQQGGYSFDVAFAIGMVLSSDADDANIDKINNYAIYADGTQVGTTRDNSYVVADVADGTHTYEVAANYADGRQSPRVAATLDVEANLDVLAAVSEIDSWKTADNDVAFSWVVPSDDDKVNITYSSDTYAQTIESTEEFHWGYIARAIYPTSKFKGLNGYMVNQVRFYPVSDALFSIAIYKNGELVSYTDLDEDAYTLGQWNVVDIDDPFVIDANAEYTLDIECFDGEANTGPLAVDNLPYVSGYSELASTDEGESYADLSGSTGTGNWMMGLVAVAPDPRPLPVDGFSVRVDNQTVTTGLITENSYTHSFGADADAETTHRVAVDVTYTGYGAVRGTTTFFTLADVQGTPTGIDNTVTVDMRVYPNPATNFVAVEGANVEEISAYSLGGALMGSTTEGRLDVSSYAPGLYILKVKADGKVATVKLNVVR